MFNRLKDFIINSKAPTKALLNSQDFNRYSEKGTTINLLTSLNSEFNTTLELTNNLTFKPGTYAKIKEKTFELLTPHWRTKKGANTIHKLFRIDQHLIGQFNNKLNTVDAKLRRLRKQGLKLSDDEGTVIKKRLTTVLKNLKNCPDNVSYDISRTPLIWSNKTKWKSEYIGREDFESYHFDDTYTDLFLNIKVEINDIIISYYNGTGSDERIVFTEEFGDIDFHMTMSFEEILGDNNRTGRDTRWAIHSEVKSINPGVMHPFINNGWDSYSSGNTCLGNWDEVFKTMRNFDLTQLAAYLRSWASTYSLYYTSPLNNHARSYIGKPIDGNADSAAYRVVTADACQNACSVILDSADSSNLDELKEAFAAEHCLSCIGYVKDCSSLSYFVQGPNLTIRDIINQITWQDIRDQDEFEDVRMSEASYETLHQFLNEFTKNNGENLETRRFAAMTGIEGRGAWSVWRNLELIINRLVDGKYFTNDSNDIFNQGITLYYHLFLIALIIKLAHHYQFITELPSDDVLSMVDNEDFDSSLWMKSRCIKQLVKTHYISRGNTLPTEIYQL